MIAYLNKIVLFLFVLGFSTCGAYASIDNDNNKEPLPDRMLVPVNQLVVYQPSNYVASCLNLRMTLNLRRSCDLLMQPAVAKYLNRAITNMAYHQTVQLYDRYGCHGLELLQSRIILTTCRFVEKALVRSTLTSCGFGADSFSGQAISYLMPSISTIVGKRLNLHTMATDGVLTVMPFNNVRSEHVLPFTNFVNNAIGFDLCEDLLAPCVASGVQRAQLGAFVQRTVIKYFNDVVRARLAALDPELTLKNKSEIQDLKASNLSLMSEFKEIESGAKAKSISEQLKNLEEEIKQREEEMIPVQAKVDIDYAHLTLTQKATKIVTANTDEEWKLVALNTKIAHSKGTVAALKTELENLPQRKVELLKTIAKHDEKILNLEQEIADVVLYNQQGVQALPGGDIHALLDSMQEDGVQLQHYHDQPLPLSKMDRVVSLYNSIIPAENLDNVINRQSLPVRVIGLYARAFGLIGPLVRIQQNLQSSSIEGRLAEVSQNYVGLCNILNTIQNTQFFDNSAELAQSNFLVRGARQTASFANGASSITHNTLELKRAGRNLLNPVVDGIQEVHADVGRVIYRAQLATIFPMAAYNTYRVGTTVMLYAAVAEVGLYLVDGPILPAGTTNIITGVIVGYEAVRAIVPAVPLPEVAAPLAATADPIRKVIFTAFAFVADSIWSLVKASQYESN